jgi:hypothetical protein
MIYYHLDLIMSRNFILISLIPWKLIMHIVNYKCFFLFQDMDSDDNSCQSDCDNVERRNKEKEVENDFFV